ncbi:ABC transporter permease [Mucilaginibacter sp. FT3.2]|uniref:ABC transporter permease n=1 Tax=Mucilaginibacter sp. FT3.2 TaxID=2723090 RepID=UPI0016171D79|nr:ABC transporter permease [Mucilaginibacter sp. FT3.2]MBB6234785.1 putative ABC transport system permease protein [Mucilaginibacter sp. FT3.2]
MIKNYIKTAFRTLKKNIGFTLINVLGLALGLATCLLIIFYVVDELSYDRYNIKADRIYRVNNDIKFGGNDQSYASSPAPLGAALVADIPEVEKTVRLINKGGNNVKKGNQNIKESQMLFADATLFDVFTLPMIAGDPQKALIEPHTVVINETVARRYFNDPLQAVGKTLTFNDSVLYKVTGVIKDIPKQSHFNFGFFLSMSTLAESKENAWFSNNFNTYVLLREGADPQKFKAKLPLLMRKYAGPQLQSILHITFDQFEKAGNKYQLNLIALKDIHLMSNCVSELAPNGNIQYVYIFTAVAIFILLIACVNFMNLSTARSSNRAREVGVRKVLGSPRKYLILQFLSESVMVTFIAAVLAIIIAYLFLPVFNDMADKSFSFNISSLTWLLPGMFVAVLIIGCLAGFYPAFFLSAFQPIEVLKGKLANGFKGSWLRSFLVVFQFSISIFLIIGTLVIYNQLQFIQHKDLGYKRDQVMVVHGTWDLGNQAVTFKNEVKQLPGVINATMTGFLPTMDYRNSSSMFPDRNLDQKKAVLAQSWTVDEDYIGTLGLKLVKGRNFNKQMGTDTATMIINETAAKLMNVADPINKMLYVPQDNMAKIWKGYRIVGVVKDFNFNSLKTNITPVALAYGDDRGALSLKVNTANITTLMGLIKNKWKSIAPNREFNYSFMDEDFDATYRAEQRMGTIAIVFTTLAIVIACLGLFGLAAYAAEQRSKEIGIRKVLGAEISTIVAMLSKDFIKLVLIAILVATPLAWLAMHQWLQSFAYRQNIQWWVIAVSAFLAVFIAFATVCFQSIKAALTNPVKSLRSE